MRLRLEVYTESKSLLYYEHSNDGKAFNDGYLCDEGSIRANGIDGGGLGRFQKQYCKRFNEEKGNAVLNRNITEG